jgi:hypothetical protein
MKHGFPLLIFLSGIGLLASCDNDAPQNEVKIPLPTVDGELRAQDTPLLRAEAGDQWTYTIQSFVPAKAYPEELEERKSAHNITLTFMGTQRAAPELPETLCWKTSSSHFPDVLEFIEDRGDLILVRGTLLKSEKPKLHWFAQPIPLVGAGMKPGMVLMESKSKDGKRSHKIEVIARETIRVPAGSFRCIRFLSTINDNGIESRRTMWYAPQNWIVREETIQYIGSKLMSRELRELTSLTRVTPASTSPSGDATTQPSGGK